MLKAGPHRTLIWSEICILKFFFTLLTFFLIFSLFSDFSTFFSVFHFFLLFFTCYDSRFPTTLSPNITLSSSCRSTTSTRTGTSRLSNNSSLTKSVKRKSDDDETLSSNSSSDSVNPGTPTKVLSCTSKQRQVFPKNDFYVCTVEDRDYFIQKQATAAAPL